MFKTSGTNIYIYIYMDTVLIIRTKLVLMELKRLHIVLSRDLQITWQHMSEVTQDI